MATERRSAETGSLAPKRTKETGVLEQHRNNLRVVASPAGAAWTLRTLDKAAAWARLADRAEARLSREERAAGASACASSSRWPATLRRGAASENAAPDSNLRTLLGAVVHSAYASAEVRTACVEMDRSLREAAAMRELAERELRTLAPVLEELGWTLADAVRRVAEVEAEARGVSPPPPAAGGSGRE